MLRAGLIFALASVPALAGEYAVLSSGLRIHADRHERAGDRVLLYSNQGVTDLPASVVTAIEDDGYVPPPAPAVEEPKAPAPPPPPVAKDPQTLVREAAVRSGLPPAFVESVAKVESAFDPRAVSPKGALGVMQLMPDTAHTLGADPRDVEQNIDAGARLLRDLLIKYGGDVVKALAAYNAGSGAVDRYQGLPPFNETQQYVNKVVRGYIQAGGR